jgi:hypothetical protein
MLGWLVDHEIDPHIPVWDQTEVAADGIYSRAEFTYDGERDLYICPPRFRGGRLRQGVENVGHRS